MARRRDLLSAPKPNPELRLPGGYVYLTWQGEEHTHASRDGRQALCGRENRIEAHPFVTGDPMGKPRCFKCLDVLGIEPLPDEPRPLPKDAPDEESPAERTPPGPAELDLPELPPDFFR